jgi:cytochrome c oxidase assembly protein subunit 15
MASIFHSFPMLRAAAPRLTKQFFTCQARQLQTRRPIEVVRKSKPSWILLCHKNFQSTHAPSHISAIAQGVRTEAGTIARKSAWPQTSSKSVAYWLLGSAASVFGIVIWGGLTRLTESGYVPHMSLLSPHTRPLTVQPQSQHNRMAPSDRLLLPHKRPRLGL